MNKFKTLALLLYCTHLLAVEPTIREYTINGTKVTETWYENYFTEQYTYNGADITTFRHVKSIVGRFFEIDGISPGLNDEAIVLEAVNASDYVTALAYVRGEPNKSKRLNFIRKMANQGHAPFMFELARELLSEVKYLGDETFIEAYAWQRLGLKRTDQDALCCRDETAGAASGLLCEMFMKKFMACSRRDDFNDEYWVVRLHKIYVLVQEKLESLKSEELPSPRWVSYHGLEAMGEAQGFPVDSKKSGLFSESEWVAIRRCQLEKNIREACAMLESINSGKHLQLMRSASNIQ